MKYLHKPLTDAVENSGYYYHIIEMQQGTFEAGMTAISYQVSVLVSHNSDILKIDKIIIELILSDM